MSNRRLQATEHSFILRSIHCFFLYLYGPPDGVPRTQKLKYPPLRTKHCQKFSLSKAWIRSDRSFLKKYFQSTARMRVFCFLISPNIILCGSKQQLINYFLNSKFIQFPPPSPQSSSVTHKWRDVNSGRDTHLGFDDAGVLRLQTNFTVDWA